MFCRPNKVLPAIVCPTKCCVNNSFENIVVPVVHPSHTTNIHHTNFQYQHHFPHTQSAVNEVTSNDIGPVPGPPPRPTGVAGVSDFGPIPGGYPGPIPGGYPGPMPGGYPGPMPGGYPGSMPGGPGPMVGGVSGFGPGLKGKKTGFCR